MALIPDGRLRMDRDETPEHRQNQLHRSDECENHVRSRLRGRIREFRLKVRGGKVRIGIAAPGDVRIRRDELLPHADSAETTFNAMFADTAEEPQVAGYTSHSAHPRERGPRPRLFQRALR